MYVSDRHILHSNLNADPMYPKDNVSFQEKQREWKLILEKKILVLDIDTYGL